MKCRVCKTREAKNNSIVCSDNCNKIRLTIMKLVDKYTSTHGCDNCWGDLRQGCTPECKNEFRRAGEFSEELYLLVRMALDNVEHIIITNREL